VRLVEGCQLGAYALAVSADGTKAAAGCKDGVVREFALADGRLLRELHGHRGYVRSVAYTRNADRLLSSADDGAILAWSAQADEPMARLEGHRGGVLTVAVSPDDKWAISGGRDGSVRLWDLAQDKLAKTLQGHRGWVEAAAFAGETGYGVSVGRDGCLLRWDLRAGRVAGRMEHHESQYALACSRDGGRAFSAGDSGQIVCWDLVQDEQRAVLAGDQRTVRGLALSPDEKLLVSASADATLLVWDLRGVE
jgi:WD40 repeat protein